MRFYKRFELIVCLVICFPVLGLAQSKTTTESINQIAITEDGRRVFLKTDGTWEYLNEDMKSKLDAARSLLKENKPSILISTNSRKKLMFALYEKLRLIGCPIGTSEKLIEDANGIKLGCNLGSTKPEICKAVQTFLELEFGETSEFEHYDMGTSDIVIWIGHK